MTTNSYNNSKSKNNTLVNAEQNRALKARGAVGNGLNVKAPEAKVRTQNTAEALELQRRAEAKRRERAHTKPEAVRPKLPAILGFDTRDKFITKTAKTVNKYPIILGVAITLLVTLLFMFVVINAVDVNKIKIETTKKSAELEALIEQNTELERELEVRDNAEYIRLMAKNQYGMIEKKNITKYHINLDNEDKIVVVKETSKNQVVDTKSE